MREYVVVLVATLVSLAIPTGADTRITLRITPAISFAPADLNVRATVAVNDRNRLMEVSAESDDYYRSSEIQLDGDQAPRTTYVAFRSLPVGEYTVRVVVRDSRGDLLASSSSFANVIPRER